MDLGPSWRPKTCSRSLVVMSTDRGILRNAQGNIIGFTTEFYSDIIDESEREEVLEDPGAPVADSVVRAVQLSTGIRVRVKQEQPEDPKNIL